MDHIAGHQELRSAAAGPNRLKSDLVNNHPASHFALPYENHPLFSRQTSCGLPNSQPGVDGFGHNIDLEHSSPWHFVSLSESNISGRDSINAERIGWPVRPEMLSMPALRRSTTGDIHGFIDQGVCYSPIDQSHEFLHTDIHQNRMHSSSLFSSCQLPANLSAPPVSSQTEARFHLSRSLLHELSASSLSPGQPDSYFSEASCESDKGSESNDIKWDTDKNMRGWSAVNSETTWSSNADYAGTIGSSRCPQQVCQSDSRHCRVPSCACKKSSSHSTFGLPTNIDNSSSPAHSSVDLQEFGHLSTLRSTPTVGDSVFSSKTEGMLHSDENSWRNRLHNQVQSRDSSCSSTSSQDVGSPRAHVSYSEAARHGRNAASTKYSENYSRLTSSDTLSKTTDCSSNSSAVQFMIAGGKQGFVTAVQQPSCVSPIRNRPVECGASIPSRTIDHYSKYGLDFLDECEPCVSASKVRSGSSDKTQKSNKIVSTCEDQHVNTCSCADVPSAEDEAPRSDSESTNSVRQQAEGNPFFDPRRIFSAEKKKVTNRNSAEVLKVELQSVQVESIGPMKERSAEKPFFDPRRIFSMAHKPKGDDRMPTVDPAEQSKKSCSGEDIPLDQGNVSRPSRVAIHTTKEFHSSPETTRHDQTESMREMPSHLPECNSSAKTGSRSYDKSMPSSVSGAQSLHQHNEVHRTSHVTEEGVSQKGGAGHNKGRSGREPVVSKYGRTKHSNRRKPTSHRHGSSAGQMHPGRVRSDVSAPNHGNEDGVNGVVKYVWMKIDGEHLQQMLVSAATELFLIITNVLKIVVGIIVFELCSILQSAWECAMYVAMWVIGLVRAKTERWRKPKSKPESKVFSLSENITLPTTGEEAMRRLFACNGKDPYSILGLKVDCSDEDIKRYYRRQAVLVHPDKNREPGAEEAFKILNHAFEMIGEPVNRQLYDLERAKEHQNNAAMEEFTDLLTKLHEVMKETINLMVCSCCGGKHRRYPADVPSSAARYCSRCNERHAAKEGDVWAESTALGFRWHYFACMEGEIYNITEWAKCQHEDFKHLKANSHFVMMHISTGGKGNSRPTPSESDLEHLLSSLFASASASSNGASPNPFASPFFQSPQPNGATDAQSGQTASAGSTASRGKRRKKRR